LISDPNNGDDYQASLPLYYNRRESKFSDHRPVLAVYRPQIIKINQEKKNELRKEILSRL
jgi:hypothetical protein